MNSITRSLILRRIFFAKRGLMVVAANSFIVVVAILYFYINEINF
jgi:uncharacterized membrane protein